MKAVVYSLGCKVNQYEGQAMIARFKSGGIDATDALEPADLYVINSCSVTGEADRKSRQAVSRVLKLNPEARVYVCGCSSQNRPDAFLSKPNVRYISGTGRKTAFVEGIMRDVLSNFDKIGRKNLVLPTETEYDDTLFPERTKTRGFLKVQDGCDNFCSYCIVPYLRGRSRSRRPESVVKEAEALARGSRELVISGINLSDYGKNIGLNLTDLVRAVAQVPARKRFGSLECTVIDDRLLTEMNRSGFCDHFHLSLQSGSDSVLRRMNRRYDTAFFLSKVELIRKYFPDAGITTDVIAGFPEETEAEHLETERFVQKVRFTDLHVFPYSERAGTRAAQLSQVDKRVREERAARLTEIKRTLHREFLRSQLGRRLEVYVEEQEGDYRTGYTSNYVKVYTHRPLLSFQALTLTEIHSDGVIGEI